MLFKEGNTGKLTICVIQLWPLIFYSVLILSEDDAYQLFDKQVDWMYSVE